MDDDIIDILLAMGYNYIHVRKSSGRLRSWRFYGHVYLEIVMLTPTFSGCLVTAFEIRS